MPAKIDYKKCIGCKICYDECPMDIITWDEENNLPVMALEEECWHCGVCWMDCPKRAIDLVLPVSCW